MLKWRFTLIAALGVLAAFTVVTGLTSAVLAQGSVAKVSGMPLFAGTASLAHEESVGNPSAESILKQVILMIPTETLPGHVYVLSDGQVVAERLARQENKQPTAEDASPYATMNSRSATVRANVKVSASRQIVVDGSDTITEIWSNTTGLNGTFYSLRVNEGEIRGPEHPLSQEIVAQYNRLLGEVDWNGTGPVYQWRR